MKLASFMEDSELTSLLLDVAEFGSEKLRNILLTVFGAAFLANTKQTKFVSDCNLIGRYLCQLSLLTTKYSTDTGI